MFETTKSTHLVQAHRQVLALTHPAPVLTHHQAQTHLQALHHQVPVPAPAQVLHQKVLNTATVHQKS